MRSRSILTSKSILIVDDNAYVATDLAATVEIMGGTVVGPVASVDDALAKLASTPVDAAILDADVAGAAALAARLTHQRVPFVVQAGTAIGVSLRGLCDKKAVLFRPVDASLVVSLLTVEMAKAANDPQKIPLPPVCG